MYKKVLKDGKIALEKLSGTPVQKQFKEETDINRIMEKYQKGEAITHLNKRRGVYGDFSDHKDYQNSLNSVLSAQKAFMALPSKTRKRFRNDPQELIDFLGNKDNYNEAVELGLIDKKLEDIPNATTINDDANKKSPQ